MAEYEEKEGDRISELPRSLLHEILSRIPIIDVVRTSILSKRWNYIWETFPFLIFDERFYFSLADEANWKNELLMEKAEQMILSRCHEEEPNLLTLFWLIPEHKSCENSSLYLQTFIPNLAKTRLQELSIFNDCFYGIHESYNNVRFQEKYHKLPSHLILPDSIKKLYFYRLGGLKSLLPYGTVKFKHLSMVELDDVVMEDEVVNGLSFVCPSLESLRIHNCSGLKNLHLTGLPKLKTIVLMRSSLKTLKMEYLPQIEILCIKFNKNLSLVDITNTTSTDSVRLLEFYGNFLTQNLFNEFVYKCRFLEILGMGATENLKTINISMDTIETIIINNVKKLVGIEMTTPALKDFQIFTDAYTNPPTIFWNFPNPKTEIFVALITNTNSDWLHYIPDDDKLEIWLDFFGYFSHVKELHLRIPLEFLIWIYRGEGSVSVSPLHCVENIVYYNTLPDFSPPIPYLLVSLIFLAPQATTISFKDNAITKNSSCSNIIFKIQYAEKEANYQFEFLGIEDWLHSVSKVILEKYHGDEYNWKELIKFFNKFKNLNFVLPENEEEIKVF